jgi:hypothetical protein
LNENILPGGLPAVKEVWTEHFLLQKLNYIHYNPRQAH